MQVAEVETVMREFIKEHHTYGAEMILTELVYAMKKDDPYYRDGTGLVRILVSAIRRAAEDGSC